MQKEFPIYITTMWSRSRFRSHLSDPQTQCPDWRPSVCMTAGLLAKRGSRFSKHEHLISDLLSRREMSLRRGEEGHIREWWAVQDLNLWPSVCKTDALTAELTAHWRAWGGSNPRPQPSQGCALIQLSYRRLSVWCRGWDLNPHALSNTTP